MAITGAHVLLYTPEAERLRATLRDVFGWRYVDAGDGWLIFALPPSEIGVHPAEGPTWESGARHQFSLMCDDINATGMTPADFESMRTRPTLPGFTLISTYVNLGSSGGGCTISGRLTPDTTSV